jgi:hypothetical protein
MNDLQEPRRWKLPSELTDDEQAAGSRFGANGRRFERPEYREWREHVLRDERDNLQLRGRLLEEQAEVLRTRAADQKTDVLGKLTAADWIQRDVEKGAARETGREPEPLPDGGAAELEADADRLEAEAGEIANYLAAERDRAE